MAQSSTTAGPELLAYCKQLDGCATGAAVITPAFNLAAKYIIHTVGPIWHGGTHNEAKLLASCYKSCLAIADDKIDIHSIAFPAISCGIFGYPLSEAVQIAVQTVCSTAKQCVKLNEIIFVCFAIDALHLYQKYLEELN